MLFIVPAQRGAGIGNARRPLADALAGPAACWIPVMHLCRPRMLLLAALAPALVHAQAAVVSGIDPSASVSAALALALREPAADRGNFSLYVGAQASTLALAKVVIWIDGEEAAHYSYSEDQARSLAAGALQPLYRHELAAGAHRLRALAIAVDPQAPPYSPRSRVQLEAALPDAGAQTVQVELRFTQGSAISTSALTLQPLPDAASAAQRAADFLLDDQRPLEAAEQLAGTDADDASPRLMRIRQQLGLDAPVAIAAQPGLDEYDQAVAQLGAGDSARALDLLDALGRRSDIAAPLADRANLALGDALLRAHRNAPAGAAYARVHRDSAWASAALLGLGWSHLLSPNAATEAQPASYALPADADQAAQARRAVPFRYYNSVVSGARADDVRQALLAWTELIGRDPADPSVQEGMLAVPYAMSHLGAQAQAEDYALRAITRLAAVHALLRDGAALLHEQLPMLLQHYFSERSDGWHSQFADLTAERRWWLEGSGDERIRDVLAVLMQEPAFRVALRDERDALLLRDFCARRAAATLPAADAQLQARQARLLEIGEQLIARRAHDTANNL
ncbi:MAG TPA: hypothetical protein VHE37_01720, partial [Nevskiaceae bacterium]|nr:hypothetical protein [Nevskiaceae bacterium]